MKKFIALAFSLLMMASLAVPAMAASYDVDMNNGSVEVHDSGVRQNGQDVEGSDDGSNSINVNVTGSSTENNITVNTSQETEVNLDLDNVTIDMSQEDKAAIDIQGDSNVTVNLQGNNTLTGGENHAAIEAETEKDYTTDANGVVSSEIQSQANVTVTAGQGVENSLTAQGGAGAAGIGGGNHKDGGAITIQGDAQVTANGNGGGAGIGSGASFYGGTNHGGYNIRITGGTVTAIGEAGTSKDGTPIYNGAAGIGGGGEYCFGRNISITGGEVTAAGNGGGAAIGGSRLGEGCTVKISKDAIVHAAMSVTSDRKYTGPCFGDGAGSDADGKEITPDYSALRKGGLVEFFDPDGKLLRSYSLDTPSGVLK